MPSLSLQVEAANYGNTGSPNTGCTNADVAAVCDDRAHTMPIVEEKCNGERVCWLDASDEVFGSNCGNDGKYLEVGYNCGAWRGVRSATVLAREVLVTTF